ncbi:GPR1/FUN34/YaaH family transporter [Streptomyces barkulensis]|uniref:GPR1/FUN34/YaaH family transporter n=1 Tax=Streptomyces barkulensis TaxID=1257026 RepID=UPI000C6CDEAE|nr:GPR1/FUN34/YaaH family transporter [Streptomyces barkulensis]
MEGTEETGAGKTGEGPTGTERRTRIVLRPTATPLPLGFLALGFATFLFAALQLDWLRPHEGRLVALAVLLLTVPLQLLASVLGFLCRDPGAGTAMGLLAGTWAVAAGTTALTPPGSHSDALGLALLASAVALLVAAAADGGKLVAAAVVTLSAVRFAVTGTAELTASPAWESAAGVTGLVLAALACYAALAFLLENALGRAVLPVLRGKPAGDEPGVRPRL